MQNKLVTLLLISILVFTSNAAHAQALDPNDIQKPQTGKVGVPELRQQAGKALGSGNYLVFQQSMEQLHELRPNNSDYMYQLVLAHALMDDKSAAFNIMMQMQRQGLSYDFNQSEASENLRTAQLYDYLNDLMITAGEPLGSVDTVATLPAEVVRPEAIAWDEGREAFLVGTVRDGTIIAVSRNGTSKELIRANESNGVWGIYDIAVDAERNRLWATSASSNEFSGYDPVDKGRSALLEFDLNSLELIKRYPVPVDGLPHKLRNMALAPNGDIYLGDGVFPIVYAKKAAWQKMRALVAFKDLVSLRGLDISKDGKMLYVADYEMGIVALNIENGDSMHLGISETLNLGGIEGLSFWENHLVIIQNGIKPQRIMSLELGPSGRAVVNVAPIAVALDVMDFPKYGMVMAEELIFFANSHSSTGGENLKPVTIASVSLSDLPDMVSPDMKEFLSNYKRVNAENKAGNGNPEVQTPEPEEETERRD